MVVVKHVGQERKHTACVFVSQVCSRWRSQTAARDRRPGGGHSAHPAHQPRKSEIDFTIETIKITFIV